MVYIDKQADMCTPNNFLCRINKFKDRQPACRTQDARMNKIKLNYSCYWH